MAAFFVTVGDYYASDHLLNIHAFSLLHHWLIYTLSPSSTTRVESSPSPVPTPTESLSLSRVSDIVCCHCSTWNMFSSVLCVYLWVYVCVCVCDEREREREREMRCLFLFSLPWQTRCVASNDFFVFQPNIVLLTLIPFPAQEFSTPPSQEYYRGSLSSTPTSVSLSFKGGHSGLKDAAIQYCLRVVDQCERSECSAPLLAVTSLVNNST